MDLAMSTHLMGLKDVKGKGREEEGAGGGLIGGEVTSSVASSPPKKDKPARRPLPRARKAAITMVSPYPVTLSRHLVQRK